MSPAPAAVAGARAAAIPGASSIAGAGAGFGARSSTSGAGGAIALPVPGIGRRRRKRRSLERWSGLSAALLGLFLLVLLVPFLVISVALRGTAQGPTTVPPGSGIPPVYVPIYRQAEEAFRVNWLLVASIHKQECDFSRSTLSGCHSGFNCAGAAGPMQFGVGVGNHGCGDAGNSWATYKLSYRKGRRPADYPYRVAPHPSVYDDFDAVMAAGAYLKNAGGTMRLDESAYRAALAYNPASWYAREVVERARAWQAAIPKEGPGLPPPVGGGRLGMIAPVKGPIAGVFGEPRPGHRHAGVDIAAPAGRPILAAQAGRVEFAGVQQGYGNFTCIGHTVSVSTCYAHQSRIGVRVGQVVRRGEAIGAVGCTGHCFGDHLHFEVRVNGEPVDPERYVRLR